MAFLSEQFALTFTGEIHGRLLPPREIGGGTVGSSGKNRWFTSGLLPLNAHGEDGKTKVQLTILVGSDWIKVPPYAICHEKFIRRETDWHAYPDGGLCYVLQMKWKDRLENIFEKRPNEISYLIDYGATWLLASVDSLISRHLLANRHGIEVWPKAWEAYAHYDEGLEEYLQEKNMR